MENKEIILKYLIEEKDKLCTKIINSNKEDNGKYLVDATNFDYISNLIKNLLEEE